METTSSGVSSEPVAIVTGGTRGIGRAISLRLARAGMIPIAIYRADRDAAEQAARELKSVQPRAEVVRADAASPAEIGALVSDVRSRHGRIDVLVNNAYRGGRTPKKTHEVPPEELQEDIGANLVGPFLMSRACLAVMLERRYGRIVFIGSLAMHGERGRVAYSTAKAGLTGLARTIAQEYAADGVTSNVVNPGFIDAGAFLRLDAAIKERAAKRAPSGRLGAAEEVAELVAYLCSPEAGYTTGQVIGVDGGAR